MIKALLLMLIAMSCIPAGDTAGKILVAEIGLAPVIVAWARFLVGGVALFPFAGREGAAILGDWRVWGRGVALVGGITSILTALQTAPIASVFAAFFIGPIVSYVLSAIFLREITSGLRSALMGVGFLGVLLVVRPGLDAAPGLGFAVLAGVFYGVYLTSSRALRDLARPRALLFSQMVAGVVLLSPVVLLAGLDWPPLTPGLLVLLLASGLFSMAGNLLLLMAYRLGTASALAPMIYFQLIAATALGWWVFEDLPDALTWAGLALIIGAGLASARAGRASFVAPLAPRADGRG